MGEVKGRTVVGREESSVSEGRIKGKTWVQLEVSRRERAKSSRRKPNSPDETRSSCEKTERHGVREVSTSLSEGFDDRWGDDGGGGVADELRGREERQGGRKVSSQDR